MTKVQSTTPVLVPMQVEQDDPFDSGVFTLPDDIFQYTDHVKVGYEEVLSEPNEYKSTPVGKAMSPIVSNVFGKVYDLTQAGFYYVLSIILGIFLSILWGLVMAINNFFLVWVCHPMIKLLFTQLRLFYLINRAALRALLDPCFESIALTLSHIRGKISLNVRGVPHLTQASIGEV